MQEPILTIPSRALAVWRRLYTRYSLEPAPATVSPDVSKTIVPVTQADVLLERPRSEIGAGTATATGDLQLVEVPVGRRWTLQSVHIRRATGDSDLDRVILRDLSENEDVIIDIFTEAASRTVPPLLGQIVLEELDTIRINISTFVSSSLWLAHLWITEQDLF